MNDIEYLEDQVTEDIFERDIPCCTRSGAASKSVCIKTPVTHLMTFFCPVKNQRVSGLVCQPCAEFYLGMYNFCRRFKSGHCSFGCGTDHEYMRVTPV